LGDGNVESFKVFMRAAAAALVLAPLPSGARAEEAADYAPQNIEKTIGHYSWLCKFQSLCPVTQQVLGVIRRAIAHDRSAEYLLGLTLLTGDGLPRDRAAGVVWVVRAAEQGEPDAARDIAGRMRNGESITIDETKVAAALKVQSDAGDAASMRALGPMYIAGRGVKQDLGAGLGLLRRAAEKGSSDAEKDLSQLYLNGAPGLPRNRPEAMKWLGVSAGHGNVDAMVSLGYMSMSNPSGTPSTQRNLAQGFCWLMRAALLDHAQAQEKLSMIYGLGEKDDHGTVIATDFVQADRWFRLAARSPYHDNSQIRAMIEPHMTTEQLGEAKRLVESWHALTVQDLKTTTIALPSNGAARNCPAMP
jgi:TPR repeat protein